jgi:hypothetical protein
VVSGWPNLRVEAYTQAVPAKEATDYIPTVAATECLRLARLGHDILLGLFKGEILTLDIHEYPETIHFGVDAGDDPSKVDDYTKRLRDKDTGKLGDAKKLSWKSPDKRTLDITHLAQLGKADNSAEFGVTMIEGVEKVRFMASSHSDLYRWHRRPGQDW